MRIKSTMTLNVTPNICSIAYAGDIFAIRQVLRICFEGSLRRKHLLRIASFESGGIWKSDPHLCDASRMDKWF